MYVCDARIQSVVSITGAGEIASEIPITGEILRLPLESL